jgi:hypothetical protein
MTSHKYIYLHANMQRVLNLTLRASTSFKGLPPSITTPSPTSTTPRKRLKWTFTSLTSYGAGSLAVLVKSISAVRPYFICPAAMPYRQRWPNFQYLEGSTICTGLGFERLCQRFLSCQIEYSCLFVMTFRLRGQTVRLHKASGNEGRLMVACCFPCSLQSTSTHNPVLSICCRGPHLGRTQHLPVQHSSALANTTESHRDCYPCLLLSVALSRQRVLDSLIEPSAATIFRVQERGALKKVAAHLARKARSVAQTLGDGQKTSLLSRRCKKHHRYSASPESSIVPAALAALGVVSDPPC